jgi:hypothetical protein
VAVRRGMSQRRVARKFGVSLCTVQRWVSRAEGQRLNRVDWDGRRRGPMHPRRTDPQIEHEILAVRKTLKDDSDLGEYGALAIWNELQTRGVQPCPSVRTIGRVLERRGVFDGRKRVRRPAPPRGWYLPDLAAQEVELDSFDTIEGLAIRGGTHLTILTGISLHGGLPTAWPRPSVTARAVLETLVDYWRRMGLPGYAQFDNDNRFQGPRQHPDNVGRVTRLCLSLGVTPVFAPPNETGFQAAIESFNGRWQAKVWVRFEHQSLEDLMTRSEKYILAARRRSAARIEAAPRRAPFPPTWRLDLQAHPQGTIVYLRRSDDKGRIGVLGHRFDVDTHWVHRLVRTEIDLAAGRIRFFALRRREPTHQPLLNEVPYQLPQRPFGE